MKLEQKLALDFKTIFKSENKQLIIFEDLFGKSVVRYNEDIHSNLLNILKPHVKDGVSKFIITIRSYTSEDGDEKVTKHDLLSNAMTVNLNDNFSLSLSEKRRMLISHAHQRGLNICHKNCIIWPQHTKSFDQSEIDEIIRTTSYLGFPEACRLFCSIKQFFFMGKTFFTSPTEELLKQIRRLKRSGYCDIDSALQYCVLVGLMLETKCEDSYCKQIHQEDVKSHESLKNMSNVECYFIEYLYHSLYNKDISITNSDLNEMCQELSDKYIKKDINRNIYVYQHDTVLQAVLSSYWNIKTMEDVIKYCSVDTLAEYVRPFDCRIEGYTKYLIVQKPICITLAHKLFQMFITGYNLAVTCEKIIDKSEFTVNLLNQKLSDWYKIEANLIDCEWKTFSQFIRPSNYKNKNSIIYAHANDNALIERLLIQIDEDAFGVFTYIERYGYDNFVENFNEQLTERLKSDENLINYTWIKVEKFIRPETFKIEFGQLGIKKKNINVINRLINELVKPMIFHNIVPVKRYIEKHGCPEFVKDFKRKFTEWFRSAENVENCTWDLIYYFVRPKTFNLDTIEALTNDNILIQIILDKLVKSDKLTVIEIRDYLTDFGCGEFIKSFNEKLRDWLQSEENVVSCKWDLIQQFVRPILFQSKKEKIGASTNDRWLIERLIKELVTVEADRSGVVKQYIETYGNDDFFKYFIKTLRKWFQSKDNFLRCRWSLIDRYVRPSTFKLENGQTEMFSNDSWLIQRIINEYNKQMTDAGKYSLFVPRKTEKYTLCVPRNTEKYNAFVQRNTERYSPFLLGNIIPKYRSSKYGSVVEVKQYVAKYGCDEFVQQINEKLAEWYKSEEVLVTSSWEFIFQFVRPTTFKKETVTIVAFVKSKGLIQRLISELVDLQSNNVWQVKEYITKFTCDKFVAEFNEELTKYLQSEDCVALCSLDLIYHFVIPTTVMIDKNIIGSCTKDDWLIQRLINELVQPKADNVLENWFIKEETNWIGKPRAREEFGGIDHYIEKYRSEVFVNNFNEKLTGYFKSEENVVNCRWNFLIRYVRPTTFKIENGNICILINDNMLIKRLINELVTRDKHKVLEVKRYVDTYGCDEFVSHFNKKFANLFQSEENVLNSTWIIIDFFLRPTACKIKNGEIGALINNSWLIQRLLNELVELKTQSESEIKEYIQKFGCTEFVIGFNKRLTEWFHSEKNVANCKFNLIYLFVRPKNSDIKTIKIEAFVNNNWLIPRIIKELMISDGSQEWSIKNYIENFGSEFIKIFNEKLAECFQSEKNIVNCNWNFIQCYVRPSMFKVENLKIGFSTNDNWLIRRIINELIATKAKILSVSFLAIRKLDAYQNPTGEKALAVQEYILQYGHKEFVRGVNRKLKKWFQSETNIVSCTWEFLNCFVRPSTFKVDNGKIGTFTNDSWLIQKIIKELVELKPTNSFDALIVQTRRICNGTSMKFIAERVWEIKQYFEKYACEGFVTEFNKKLTERLQSEVVIENSMWELINNFVRPTMFKIENGKLGSHTNDNWLIQRIICELLKPEKELKSDRHMNFREPGKLWYPYVYRKVEVKQYIENYGYEKFINDFNKKFTEWFMSKENVVNCEWELIDFFVRPARCKIEKGPICIMTTNKELIHRLINELNYRTYQVKTYIESYGDDEFVTNFNEQLSRRLNSKQNVLNSRWTVIEYFVRPSTFKLGDFAIGSFTNDRWLIQRILNELRGHLGHQGLKVKQYTELYGNEQFIKDCNAKLTEWFESDGNLLNCEWDTIHHLLRPSTCRIECGKIGAVVNDGCLIQNILSVIVKPNAIEKFSSNTLSMIKQYVEMYGCDNFVNELNKKLTALLQSKENIFNCSWNSINYFVRPEKFKIEHGIIGTFTNDSWLIQRIIKEFWKSEDKTLLGIKQYIEMYGCEEFVKDFNKNLTEWFQSQKNVADSSWCSIDNFIRPTTFSVKNGKIGSFTNDNWLIQRIIKELVEDMRCSTISVKQYLEKYGCKAFVMDFNTKMADWYKSEESVVNCSLEMIDYFIRPMSFKIEYGQIGTLTNDNWLIKRLINGLKRFEHDILQVKEYIEKYGCEEFVKMFNKKLREFFQIETNVRHRPWILISNFLRPSNVNIKTGKIGTCTNDTWLSQRLITEFVKTESHEILEVQEYIKTYGCQEFLDIFNKSLEGVFHTEKSVVSCKWHLIYHFVRPNKFQIEKGIICAHVNESWLIRRLFNELLNHNYTCYNRAFSSQLPMRIQFATQKAKRLWQVKQYIETYGCEKFVEDYNQKLAEWFMSEENVVNCTWTLIYYFVRPVAFKTENAKINTFTDDNWLIQRLIHELMKPANDKSLDVKLYIKKYGCAEFVKKFNGKLTPWFHSEGNVMNCRWGLIYHFVRPNLYTVEEGEIGTFTNDIWLMKRLNIELLKRKHRIELDVTTYIEKYASLQFVEHFKEMRQLSE